MLAKCVNDHKTTRILQEKNSAVSMISDQSKKFIFFITKIVHLGSAGVENKM